MAGEISRQTVVRRRLARGSRSDVGWFLLGLAGLQLGLAAGIAQWWPQVRDPEYGYRLARLRTHLAAEPHRPLLLVLGSSRVANGFRPGAAPAWRAADGTTPQLFNFGVTAAGPLEQLLYLRCLLKQGVCPRWVFLEVSPMLLLREEDAERPSLAHEPGWYDLAALRRYFRHPARFYAPWCLRQLVPWSSYRYFLLGSCLPSWVSCADFQDRWWRDLDDSGWCPLPDAEVPAAEYRRRAAQVTQSFPLRATRVPTARDRALRELLGLCRRLRIVAALLLMPEGSDFRKSYAPAARAALEEYLGRLQREFGVPVIDARGWVDDRGFADSIHLLPRGAAAFTTRLGSEVLQPLLEGKLLTSPYTPPAESAKPG